MFSGLGGNKVLSVGQIVGTLELTETYQVMHPFQVIEAPEPTPFDGILGLDFLIKHGGSIHASSRTIEIRINKLIHKNEKEPQEGHPKQDPGHRPKVKTLNRPVRSKNF